MLVLEVPEKVHLGSGGDSTLGLSSTSASVLELYEPTVSQMTKSNQQICFRGVRSSKFRHVYGCVGKREKCYEGLTITKNAHDSHFCAANPKFLAVVTEVAGGGCFAVVPIHETGRVDLVVGRVTGHSGPVLDIKWNPFNDNVIASCSDDCTIKLWHIPDGGIKGRGGTATLDEWLVDLHGHTRRVGHIEWHPTVDGVLVSAGFDRLLIIWNIAQGNAIRVLDSHPDSLYSMCFNRDGSRLATTCKDKKLRIFDPRTGNLIQEGRCHEGAKASKVAYLGQSGRLATTGFSRYSDRQLALWEESDLSKPLRIEDIDSSSGVIFPIYDPDTRILYLAGKGDGNIRYYEIVDADPWWFYLNQYLSGYPQRGLGIMPKRGVDPSVCEIMRFYKLHASRGLVEPVSMIVPRKSDSSCFHEDLYPNTPGPTATVTAAEWLDGKNAAPLLISLKSGWKMPTNKPVVYKPNEKKLITSDLNNERKFLFISQETHPDYRSLDMKKGPSTANYPSASFSNGENSQNVEVNPTNSSSSLTTTTPSAVTGKSGEQPSQRMSPPAVTPRRRSAASDSSNSSEKKSPSSPKMSKIDGDVIISSSSVMRKPQVRQRVIRPLSSASTSSAGQSLALYSESSSGACCAPDSGTSTATPSSPMSTTVTSEEDDEYDDNRRLTRHHIDIDDDDDDADESSDGCTGANRRTTHGKRRPPLSSAANVAAIAAKFRFSQSLDDVRRGGSGTGPCPTSLPPQRSARVSRSQSVMWRRPKGRLISELIAALQRQASFSDPSTEAEDSSSCQHPGCNLSHVVAAATAVTNGSCDVFTLPRSFRRSSLCRSEPHLPMTLGHDMARAQEQELVQGGGLSLSDLNAHNHLLPQDKEGVVLSPGASRFHEIQKMWGDRTGAAPNSNKTGEGIMSMSVDSIPFKDEQAAMEAEPEKPASKKEQASAEKRESRAELKSEIRELKSQLKEKDVVIHSLKSEVSDLKHQMVEMQAKMAALDNHVDDGRHSDDSDQPMEMA